MVQDEELTGEARAYERTQMQKDMVIEKLREQGCRITRQRRMILDIILEEECACCKEIFYRVQEKDKKIGPATIYRMVNMLEKIGAISRKNMYKISGCDFKCDESVCIVRLSDDTTFRLPKDTWKEIVKAGMKDLGYIQEQDITSIDVKGS